MKLTKENVCVFIKDEVQLEQAMELLVKYGEEVGDKDDMRIDKGNNNMLKLSIQRNYWYIGSNFLYVSHLTKITLTELEQILKDGKEN